MNTVRIRLAAPFDLPVLEEIETACFPPVRRSSRRSLRHSLLSPVQSVWIASSGSGAQKKSVGAMILHHHPGTIRIFSLAVLSAYRGSGTGAGLVQKAVDLARKTGREQVTLEADAGNRVLIGWYERQGFAAERTIRDYYSPGRDAVRMKRLVSPGKRKETSWRSAI